MGSNQLIIPAIALVTIMIGLVFEIVGMATPMWSKEDDYNGGGPIRFMVDGTMKEAGRRTDAIKAVVAMVVLGMVAGVVALACAAVIVLLLFSGKDKISALSLVTIGSSVLSFLFTEIGVVVWGAKVHKDANDDADKYDVGFSYDIGYSFCLSLVGGVLVLVGGILAYIPRRTTD